MLSVGADARHQHIVLANLAPRAVHEMCSLYARGKQAESLRLQLHYLPVIEALFADVSPIAVKAALEQMGDARGPECRMPLGELDGAKREKLYESAAKSRAFGGRTVMTRVLLLGAAGRMGRAVQRAARAVPCVEPWRPAWTAARPMAAPWPPGSLHGLSACGIPADVLVEFSSPQAVAAVPAHMHGARPAPCVLCTTGLSPAQQAAVRRGQRPHPGISKREHVCWALPCWPVQPALRPNCTAPRVRH